MGLTVTEQAVTTGPHEQVTVRLRNLEPRLIDIGLAVTNVGHLSHASRLKHRLTALSRLNPNDIYFAKSRQEGKRHLFCESKFCDTVWAK
jgi:hypothetical protein